MQLYENKMKKLQNNTIILQHKKKPCEYSQGHKKLYFNRIIF
jgi:hypothetical protein